MDVRLFNAGFIDPTLARLHFARLAQQLELGRLVKGDKGPGLASAPPQATLGHLVMRTSRIIPGPSGSVRQHRLIRFLALFRRATNAAAVRNDSHQAYRRSARASFDGIHKQAAWGLPTKPLLPCMS